MKRQQDFSLLAITWLQLGLELFVRESMIRSVP